MNSRRMYFSTKVCYGKNLRLQHPSRCDTLGTNGGALRSHVSTAHGRSVCVLRAARRGWASVRTRSKEGLPFSGQNVVWTNCASSNFDVQGYTLYMYVCILLDKTAPKRPKMLNNIRKILRLKVFFGLERGKTFTKHFIIYSRFSARTALKTRIYSISCSGADVLTLLRLVNTVNFSSFCADVILSIINKIYIFRLWSRRLLFMKSGICRGNM